MTGWRSLLFLLLAASFLVIAPHSVRAAGSDESTAAIVKTRAPASKRPYKVRNKFFIKKGRLEITPNVGMITTNALNDEVLASLALTYHFSDRIGLEVNGGYAFLGGENNSKSLAVAVLRLLDANFRLESVDPGALVTVSAIWSPMYGKINPFGLAVINLDFFFTFGVGYMNESIEMLSYLVDGAGAERAALAQPAELNHLFVLNFGFGAKVLMSKWFSLRLDGRILLTWDQELDYDQDETAELNRGLGPLANRLSCDDPSVQDKACKIVFPTTLILSVGGSFWVPGDKAVRNRR